MIALFAFAMLQAASGTNWGTSTDAEKSAAFKAYGDCLLNAARKFDDQRSDASTIALGIEDSCPEELQHVKDVYGKDADPDVKAAINNSYNDSKHPFAVKIVLMERRERRARSK